MTDLSLDRMDLKILDALQRDARASNVELAERVHLSPSQFHRRLKRLEEMGIIARYVALLEPTAVGLSVMAFVGVTLEKHGANPAREFAEAINGVAEILECWAVSGDYDYLLRVVAADLAGFSDFLLHRLIRLPMVAGVRSIILLDCLKSGTALPLTQVKIAQA